MNFANRQESTLCTDYKAVSECKVIMLLFLALLKTKSKLKQKPKRPSFLDQLIIFSRNATAQHFTANRLLVGTALLLEGLAALSYY